MHGAELRPFGDIGAVVLPAPLAQTIGATRSSARKSSSSSTVAPPRPRSTPSCTPARSGRSTASAVAIVPLSLAQEMTGLGARVSRILVQPAPERGAAGEGGAGSGWPAIA